MRNTSAELSQEKQTNPPTFTANIIHGPKDVVTNIVMEMYIYKNLGAETTIDSILDYFLVYHINT